MSPPTVTMRCPSCGNALRAVLAPFPPTQWFPCPTCHVPVPVVVPRDLPPLYSWEVLPGLYPHLVPPRPPRWKSRHVVAGALAVSAALAAVCAGVLAYEGFVAAQPTEYVVSGTVYEDSHGVLVPASGADVVLSVDGAQVGSTVTGPGGTFRFPSVPDGGIELNVSAPGYSPTVVYTFASKSYSTQTRGLQITLEPGGSANSSVTTLTPFGDMETLLAYVGGGAVLLGAAAVVGGAAAVVVRRPDGAVVGVIGAGAAVATPAVLVLLALGTAFQAVTIAVSVVGAVGAFALVVAAANLSTHPTAREPT